VVLLLAPPPVRGNVDDDDADAASRPAGGDPHAPGEFRIVSSRSSMNDDTRRSPFDGAAFSFSTGREKCGWGGRPWRIRTTAPGIRSGAWRW